MGHKAVKGMEQYSLSELCSVIGDAIEAGLPELYWVRAEIASLSVRGHCYIELVEKAENGILAAKVRATCWSNMYHILSAYFEQETGQALHTGMQVLLQVSVEWHAVYGLSLNIQNIDPTYTLGDLAKQRQQTLLRLQEDGVMELQQSLNIPSLPRRIAVVSAQEAAGYGDFCDQLAHNVIGFRFMPTLFAATMQGENAAASIIRALQTIAREAERWDVVVMIRGGGATTDLSCFDDYMLASHCAQFPLPIIAGIGHTRDVSVVDMVVHTSVKTPTAAAQFLIGLVETQAARLETLNSRLLGATQRMLQTEKDRLVRYQQSLRMTAQRLLLGERNRLAILQKTIELHSPERIYRMGYSLMMCDGKPVRSVNDVPVGAKMTTHLQDGTVESTGDAARSLTK